MTDYPGFFSRQSLTDFCETRAAQIAEARREYAAELVNSPESEVYDDGDAFEMGKQQAYQEVIEWAKNRIERTEEESKGKK